MNKEIKECHFYNKKGSCERCELGSVLYNGKSSHKYCIDCSQNKDCDHKLLLVEQAKNKKLVEALENAKGTIRFAFRAVLNSREDWLNFWRIVKSGYDILEQTLNEVNK